MKLADRYHVPPWAFDGADGDPSIWYHLGLIAMQAEAQAAQARANFEANWQTKR